MSNLPVTVFNYKSNEIKTIIKDGEPWFVAKDTCDTLKIINSRDAVSNLDEDEKGVAIIDTPGGPQEVLIINESGLYSLIFKSRKKQARAFKRWVTHEVLPLIRKTGKYHAPGIQISDKDKSKMLKIAEKYGKTMEQDCLETMLSQITGIQIKLVPEFRELLVPKTKKSNIIPFSQNTAFQADVEDILATFWHDIADLLAKNKLDQNYIKICNGTLRFWFKGVYDIWAKYYQVKNNQKPVDAVALAKKLKNQIYVTDINRNTWFRKRARRACWINVSTANEDIQKIVALFQVNME